MENYSYGYSLDAPLFIGSEDPRLPADVRAKQEDEDYGWFSGAGFLVNNKAV